jgi:serine/threonine-protein kinase
MDFRMARRTQPHNRTVDTAIWDPAELGGISGTTAYMAPEQARGERATPASDVFSVGLIIDETVTGRPARTQTDVLQMLRGIESENLVDHASTAPAPGCEAEQSRARAARGVTTR